MSRHAEKKNVKQRTGQGPVFVMEIGNPRGKEGAGKTPLPGSLHAKRRLTRTQGYTQ